MQSPPFCVPACALRTCYKSRITYNSFWRQVAMSCRLDNNWGCFQLHGDKWTTEHRDSTAAVPRLNCDPVVAAVIASDKFNASPACSEFIIVNGAGNELTNAELESIEWTRA